MIKMRISKNPGNCYCCNTTPDNAIKMYDLRIGESQFCLCDQCVDILLGLTLKASRISNSKIKTREDIAILRNRRKRG